MVTINDNNIHEQINIIKFASNAVAVTKISLMMKSKLNEPKTIMMRF